MSYFGPMAARIIAGFSWKYFLDGMDHTLVGFLRQLRDWLTQYDISVSSHEAYK